MKKNLIALSMILPCTIFAGGDLVETQAIEPVLSMKTVEVVQENDFFVFASGGASFFQVDTKLRQGKNFTNGTRDNEAGAFEVGVGYKIQENIFTELAFQQSILDNADVQTIYMSMNYAFEVDMLNPYIGALIGYSQLEWDPTPYTAGIAKDLTSDSSIYGVQAGASYPIMEDLSLAAKYQYIVYDHILEITKNTGGIEHKDAQQVFGGLKYEF